MDLFSMSASAQLNDSGYSYPEMPEYSLRELLLLEKESSGMYFSGHMIDDYSAHADKLKPDRISDIIAAFSDGADGESKYTERSSVRIVGIITEKKTKITKSGDTMAFLTVDDSYGEIEVIVFAKRYANFADLLHTDNAVCIDGNISVEDDDSTRIILSSAQQLSSNSECVAGNDKKEAVEPRLFIKVGSVSDKRIATLYRIAALNPGSTKIVLYDEETKKYNVMKDVTVNPRENVIQRLHSIFSEENVVLK
jgi:DNA polymerase-3 subunit alpha